MKSLSLSNHKIFFWGVQSNFGKIEKIRCKSKKLKVFLRRLENDEKINRFARRFGRSKEFQFSI